MTFALLLIEKRKNKTYLFPMGDAHVLSTNPDLLPARMPIGAHSGQDFCNNLMYFLSAPAAKNATERPKRSVFETNDGAFRKAAARTV